MATTQQADQHPADVLVVFGITGDLARVMTFRSLYRLEARGLLDCPIVGVAVDDWSVDQLVARARESIEGTGEVIDPAVVRSLPAQEIRELGETFRSLSRTLILHEAGLAEGLVRQTRLTRAAVVRHVIDGPAEGIDVIHRITLLLRQHAHRRVERAARCRGRFIMRQCLSLRRHAASSLTA